MEEKIKELLLNKDFFDKVIVLTPEDAQKEFAKEGVDISVDALLEIGEGLREAANYNNGELNAEDLDSVAGGKKYSGWTKFGFGVGFAIGASIGVIATKW